MLRDRGGLMTSENANQFVEFLHNPKSGKLRTTIGETLLRYFRVEVSGLENIPKSGPSIVLPNHSGFEGFDAMVLAHLLTKHLGQQARIFAHHTYFSLFEMGKKLSRSVGLRDAKYDCGKKTLSDQHTLIIFPEAEQGNFKPSSKAYDLQKFHTGFLRLANDCQVPIIPTTIIGAEESSINMGNIRLPFTSLLLPMPLNLFPLPIKWIIKFHPPITFNKPDIDYEGLTFEAQIIRQKMQSLLNAELKKRGPGLFTFDANVDGELNQEEKEPDLPPTVAGENTAKHDFKDMYWQHALAKVYSPLKMYHRYEIKGVNHIPEKGGALILINHSLATYDLVFLWESIYQKTGRYCRTLVDRFFYRLPILKFFEGPLGVKNASRQVAVDLLKKGELLIVSPGGMTEWACPTSKKSDVNWNGRLGFARLAIEAQVPVLLADCPGADEIYHVYDEPVTQWMARNFKMPFIFFRGVGPTPLPRPVKLTHYVSPLIHPPDPAKTVRELETKAKEFSALIEKKMSQRMSRHRKTENKKG